MLDVCLQEIEVLVILELYRLVNWVLQVDQVKLLHGFVSQELGLLPTGGVFLLITAVLDVNQAVGGIVMRCHVGLVYLDETIVELLHLRYLPADGFVLLETLGHLSEGLDVAGILLFALDVGA